MLGNYRSSKHCSLILFASHDVSLLLRCLSPPIIYRPDSIRLDFRVQLDSVWFVRQKTFQLCITPPYRCRQPYSLPPSPSVSEPIYLSTPHPTNPGSSRGLFPLSPRSETNIRFCLATPDNSKPDKRKKSVSTSSSQ